jgi:DNA-binding transcriptional ArsR family regulator
MLKYAAPVDDVFRALGDPTRRVMVERLGQGPASVSQLAEPLAMSLSAVVQHLAILEGCGLVRSEKVGRIRTCRLEPVALSSAEAWFSGQRAAWERWLDRLGDFLLEDDPGAAPATPHPSHRPGPPGPDKGARP